MDRLKHIFSLFIEGTLNILAPQDPDIERIEHMTPREFIGQVQRATTDTQYKDIRCFFSYHNPLLKSAILEVKSYGNKKIARLLGNVLYELLVEELSELAVFENITHALIVPIPMTKKSERKRGFNQCSLILKECAQNLVHNNIEISYNTLVKIKETDDQVGKTKAERFENLKNCFAITNPSFIRNKNVIVFDDIMTTGATLYEAQKTLKRAGARKVILIALSH